MSKCILHIGMSKTGSSSIQKTFFKHSSPYFNYKKSPQRLRYFDAFGQNPSQQLRLLFSKKPEKIYINVRKNISRIEADEYNNLNRGKLIKFLESYNECDVLISAEGLGGFSRDELESFKKFLNTYFDELEVVGYVRSPKSFMESAYQQNLKLEIDTFEPAKLYPNYRKRFEKYLDVFKKVELWEFNPKSFKNNCVVSDFASRLDIDTTGVKIKNSNEGYSLDALRILFAYRKYYGRGGYSQDVLQFNRDLNTLLTRIPGEKLKFSSKIIAPILDDKHDDIVWARNHLNLLLEENIYKDDDVGIDSEDDLLKCEPKAVAYLLNEMASMSQKVSSKKVENTYSVNEILYEQFIDMFKKDHVTSDIDDQNIEYILNQVFTKTNSSLEENEVQKIVGLGLFKKRINKDGSMIFNVNPFKI